MPAPVSIQLYTLREDAARDLPGLISRLGRIGYQGVETAGLHGLLARDFRGHVEDAGMVVSGAHVSLTDLGATQASRVLDDQQELGNANLVVAFLPPERFADGDQIQLAADELNAAHQRVRARGMTLGYHNHWWEFRSQVEGPSAHSALFQQLDDEIFAELDTYWVQVGGADPAKLVAELGPRARLLHLKDGPADEPQAAMTALGAGAVDVPAIVAASHAEWHVVELDRCATDMFEAVERSHAYLVASGLAGGRS